MTTRKPLDDQTRATLVALTNRARKLCVAPIDMLNEYGFIVTPHRINQIRAEAADQVADLLSNVSLSVALGPIYKSGAPPRDVKRVLVEAAREAAQMMKEGDL